MANLLSPSKICIFLSIKPLPPQPNTRTSIPKVGRNSLSGSITTKIVRIMGVSDYMFMCLLSALPGRFFPSFDISYFHLSATLIYRLGNFCFHTFAFSANCRGVQTVSFTVYFFKCL